MKQNRKGFTLIELLVVVAIIALLISILLPSLGRARELAKQAVCRSNLRGIGQSMHIYANDNREFFPVAASPSPTGGPGSQTLPAPYMGHLGRDQTLPSPQTVTAVHPSRSLFLLVIGGQSTPQQFVCPSASETSDDLRNKTGTTITAAQPGFTRFDFLGYSNLSYGYIMPYGGQARPTTNLDTRMPLGADKGPYFVAGATVADTRWQPDARNGSPPTIPPAFATTVADALRASNDQWRPYNSRNHSQEGQVVMYTDGHADFVRKPIEGVNNDNIYLFSTQSNNHLESITGVPIPANDNRGPLNDTDAFIVP